MHGDAARFFIARREQQRFLAEHEHRRGAKKMRADDGVAPASIERTRSAREGSGMSVEVMATG